MKKLLIIALAVILFTETKAQQLPLFSQYYFNSFIYNPAQTGIDRGTSIGLVARKQYNGLADALGTYAATLQSRGDVNNAGFGLYFYNDNTNLFRTNSITGNYAYHVDLADDKVLSFGIGLSVLDNRFNANNFNLISDNDPVVQLLGSEGGVSLDGNAGLNLELGKFNIGLANLQMLQNQNTFANNLNQKAFYTLARHWMFNLGYKFEINDEWELEPYVLYRKTQSAPGQADINLFLNWFNKGYAGVAYRDGMSFSTMIGVQITPNITAGYAFDLTTNEMRSALGNTNEIMLKFDLGKQQSVPAQDPEVLAANDEKLKSLEQQIEELKVLASETKRDTVVIETAVEQEPSKPEYDPAPKTTTSSDKFYVIAGSFNNAQAANTHIVGLLKKGYKAYQKFDSKSGRYYVHLGFFTEKATAIELINELKPSGLPLWIKAM